MTKLTYSKEDPIKTTFANEVEEILYLKRLLVTLKQHYEHKIQQAHVQLQAEQSQRLISQKELEKLQAEQREAQRYHQEELQSLFDQQATLKELLKKAQADLQLNSLLSQPSNVEEQFQSAQHLEHGHLLTKEERLESEHLREEINRMQKNVKDLEKELLENQQHAKQEIERLQQLLEEQKQKGHELETVVSPTSSHHLRHELEAIKRTLNQGAHETKALETRYIEILNEKISLEHLCKQLQLQLEHQSSNLISFQENIHSLEDHKKSLEVSLQIKENEGLESYQKIQELEKRLGCLNEVTKEKEYVQDKYEQLKEDWRELNDRLEEAIDIRAQIEQHLTQLETIAANQEAQLQEFAQKLQMLHQEKSTLESERDQLKNLLDENEARLKIAQQHLAKKVKENALLNEKLEEQQVNLSEFAQTIEYQKTQLAQLQASVDLYQRQEKRLQEQLHNALKGTESQVVKWEEKYFNMYDKWQESENVIRELKKFKEKHMQVQTLLANLGDFMGGAFNPSTTLFHNQEIVERTPSFSLESSEKAAPLHSKIDSQANNYGLFGTSPSPDHYNPHLFS